jgi:6-pyruvoyltetrahydropterin/6-carboxytetrahydropterin synthase
MKLTLCYQFSAAHRLHSDALSEDANWATYGRCNNPHGHGHNYRLELTVAGEPDAESGLIARRADLDKLVEQEILSAVQHRNLNIEVESLRQTVPTTENVAYAFAETLAMNWRKHFGPEGPRLERVRIHETRNNRFEIEAHEVQR